MKRKMTQERYDRAMRFGDLLDRMARNNQRQKAQPQKKSDNPKECQKLPDIEDR